VNDLVLFLKARSKELVLGGLLVFNVVTLNDKEQHIWEDHLNSLDKILKDFKKRGEITDEELSTFSLIFSKTYARPLALITETFDKYLKELHLELITITMYSSSDAVLQKFLDANDYNKYSEAIVRQWFAVGSQFYCSILARKSSKSQALLEEMKHTLYEDMKTLALQKKSSTLNVSYIITLRKVK